MLSQTALFQKQKESKEDGKDVSYFTVSEYKKDHWALQYPKSTDTNFIAILKINDVLMHVKLNQTDARGYRTIVTIVSDDMASTLNRPYTRNEKRALQTALGLVAEAFEDAGCPIVQQQIAGNNSQSLTKDGKVQIGNEKEPNMLHGHVIVRGNPKKAYIGNVVLNGPEPNVLFNMRGDGTEEGNKSKLKWNSEDMGTVATTILEKIKGITKQLTDVEIISERQQVSKSQISVKL